MKIWVTGGAGFIGSHVVDALQEDGHEGISIIDHHKKEKERNIPEGVQVIKQDFASSDVLRKLEEEKPEVIIHLAAKISAPESMEKPELYEEENVLKTVRLLEAARKAGVRRFIAISSAAVYGNSEEPVTEESKTAPLNPYGVTKRNMEEYLAYYERVYGMETVAVRPANAYGPRQQSGSSYSGVITIFIEKMLKGESPIIFGDGEAVRDFIYVKDLAALLTQLAKSSVTGVFNASSNQQTTINELWSLLQEITETTLKAEYKEQRPGDIKVSIVESSKIQREIGWHAKTPFQKGLQETYQWYLERI